MLWYIISLQKKSTIAVNKDPSIPSLTNQHEGPTKREMHCLLPCLCFLNKWRTKPRVKPGVWRLWFRAKSCQIYNPVFLGGKSKKIISSTMGCLVWIPALFKRWEGETSTWRMISFLSVLLGTCYITMGQTDVTLADGVWWCELFELFGTKRSEQIKQNSWQGRALNQPSGLVAWTCLDTGFKHPGDQPGYFGTWQGRLRGIYWWLRLRHQVGKKTW